MCVMDLLGWRLKFGKYWIVMSGIWREGGGVCICFMSSTPFFFHCVFHESALRCCLSFLFPNFESRRGGANENFLFLEYLITTPLI